jgi:tetratricopeptide (TPR) repeat protein
MDLRQQKMLQLTGDILQPNINTKSAKITARILVEHVLLALLESEDYVSFCQKSNFAIFNSKKHVDIPTKLNWLIGAGLYPKRFRKATEFICGEGNFEVHANIEDGIHEFTSSTINLTLTIVDWYFKNNSDSPNIVSELISKADKPQLDRKKYRERFMVLGFLGIILIGIAILFGPNFNTSFLSKLNLKNSSVFSNDTSSYKIVILPFSGIDLRESIPIGLQVKNEIDNLAEENGWNIEVYYAENFDREPNSIYKKNEYLDVLKGFGGNHIIYGKNEIGDISSNDTRRITSFFLSNNVISESIGGTFNEYYSYVANDLSNLKVGIVSSNINEIAYQNILYYLISENNYKDCILACSKLIGSLSNPSPDLYLIRAMNLLVLEQNDSARADLEYLLKNSKSYYPAFIHLVTGYTSYAMNDYEGAIVEMNISYNLDTVLQHLILYKRGLSYFQLGEYSIALKDFNKLLQIDSSNYKYAYLNRAMVYFNLNQRDSAIIDFKKYSSLNKESLTYDQIGRYYFLFGEYLLSLHYYRLAHSNYDFKDFNYQFASIYFNLNNWRKTIKYVSKFHTEFGSYASSVYMLAASHNYLGDEEKALDYYKSIIKQDSLYYWSYAKLGDMYFLPNPDSAILYYSEFLKYTLNQTDSFYVANNITVSYLFEVISLRAISQIKTGQIELAILGFTNKINSSHVACDDYYNRALSYFLINMKDKAKDDLEKAMARGCNIKTFKVYKSGIKANLNLDNTFIHSFSEL